MNEIYWLTGTNPMPMLGHMLDRTSHRKLRLLGLGIACASLDKSFDARIHHAINVIERYVEGQVDIQELEAAENGAWDVRDELWDSGVRDVDGALGCAQTVGFTASEHSWESVHNHPSDVQQFGLYPFHNISFPRQCDLYRCVFGNPFRPVTLDPDWLTSATVGLADAIYNTRAFHDMPILADALEEAGCEDVSVLAHCRAGGEHVRGCWVVDMLLGKS